MIWKIFKKEFLLNLMTFKFAMGTVLCVVLMAVFMPVLLGDYQQRFKNYSENIASNKTELKTAKVHKNINPTVYRAPMVLYVFSEGLEKRLANSAKIELDSIPTINAVSTEVNPYLSIFPTLDVSLIFKIVMSILSLLIAYDVISGEREAGTLKLMLSNAVGRYQVLLGKFLGGLLILIIPITVAFIVGLLIFEFSPMVKLTGPDWARIGLMYITSLLFILAMYNFGLLLSCMTGRSATSLMFVLFFWVLFLIVIPNGSLYLAGRLQALESRGKIDGQIKSILEKKEIELNAFLEKNPVGGNIWSMSLDAFGNRYTQLCDKRFMESSQKCNSFEAPLDIKSADKIWEVQHNYLSKLYKQKMLASNISRISPICLYNNIMLALARTDLNCFQHFVDSVRNYRSEVVEYIRSKTNNFSSPSYFTQCNKEDCLAYEKYDQAENETDRKDATYAFEKAKEKLIKNASPLDLEDFPQFIYEPQGIIESLWKTIPDLVILVLINVLFFVLSFVAFLGYDVR